MIRRNERFDHKLTKIQNLQYSQNRILKDYRQRKFLFLKQRVEKTIDTQNMKSRIRRLASVHENLMKVKGQIIFQISNKWINKHYVNRISTKLIFLNQQGIKCAININWIATQ
ncbi:unnamed protein product (macronuclear) [Paramecium tetraurelia]|uniref:Uncharacterized protein n=1 Tax=Paramecium tetraurelia TaxID=5888 RepID=A0DCQ9_PARTE|nr:uncharacterized protein GSPATT00039417001 [Paramecium tetraurelia]CAK80826.1 unnamed protein product [Paramecium tetraurelia]|eukprot:XP_001448223.1 hypothetical protein (macronuclear) [Paramecium tetraurelia strain d4-2]